MTVKELIRMLLSYPMDAKVVAPFSFEGYPEEVQSVSLDKQGRVELL